MKTFVNPKYERREDEDTFEYGLRLIETKIEQKPDDLDWEDIVELAGLDCHRDSLRKAASVTPYSGYAVAQHFKRRFAEQGCQGQENYMGELDCKIAKARKEAKRFYDQRREFNKMVDRIGREENLEDRLVEAALALGDTIGSIDYQMRYSDLSDSEAILVLCDWHYGMVTNNIWNKYDTEICKERVKSVFERATERITLHKCKKLHIVVLGDLIHGAAHISARVASEELVCEQLMNVSEILAQSTEYISQFVESVEVHTTFGNHARTVQNKNDSIHMDNMERIIPWWLSQRLSRHENILVDEDTGEALRYFESCGYGFCGAHGDIDNVKKSPKGLSTLYHRKFGKNVDYILLADKHHRESFEELGVTAMICGALCGTDEYADCKRLYSTPEQLLLIISPRIGLDAEYHLRCC